MSRSDPDEPRSCARCADATPFASRTLREHLARGAGAALLIALGVALARMPGSPWTAAPILACFAAALFLLRGCPLCWTIGLIETLSRRRRRAPDGAPHRTGRQRRIAALTVALR